MFKDVLFNSLVEKIADPKLPADQAVTKVRQTAIIPAVKLAVENFKEWKTLCETKQADCKKVLELAETKVQTMQKGGYVPNIYDVGEVKGAIDIINAAWEYLRSQNEAYAEAGAKDGFRGMTPVNSIQKAFPQIPEKVLEEFKAFIEQARSKINNDNRALIAIRDRVKEYGKRAEILHKTAQLVHNQIVEKVTDANEDLDKSLAKCQEHIDKCTECFRKIDNKLKSISSVLNTKNKATAPTVKGMVAERNEQLKNASGSIKTLKQELDLGRKILVGAPQAQKVYAPKFEKVTTKHKELEKAATDYKTKSFVLQDKVITSAGIKL